MRFWQLGVLQVDVRVCVTRLRCLHRSLIVVERFTKPISTKDFTTRSFNNYSFVK